MQTRNEGGNKGRTKCREKKETGEEERRKQTIKRDRHMTTKKRREEQGEKEGLQMRKEGVRKGRAESR